jgi:hypothetical protein
MSYRRVIQHRLSKDGVRVIKVLKGLELEESENAEAAIIEFTR